MKELIEMPFEIGSIWNWLFSIQDWSTLEGWMARIVIIPLVFLLAVYILRLVLEQAVKMQDSWKALGLPVTVSSGERTAIRRRQQFCRVLRSDLDTLAKSENWNDQFFTDLEAEVEAEGLYYTSALHKLLRRPTQGLRRVPSLIQAIQSSAEQSLLLVGEAGSGKSIALRHLAHLLA